jgi:hypothetical protein
MYDERSSLLTFINPKQAIENDDYNFASGVIGFNQNSFEVKGDSMLRLMDTKW